MDLSDHPCFNDSKRHLIARVHLPVAPRCNIQCNYCFRDFDCVNESRPGVTSVVLTPEQAILYLDKILKEIPNTKVVGIAGPGDPFANPEETLKTLRYVREKYPNILLCVATNGLNIIPYIDILKDLDVSHVTITINALTPETAAKIYSWYRIEKRVVTGIEGATLLLERQQEAIKILKSKGIKVKVNTVIIRDINEHEAVMIAKKVSELGADILNYIPMYKTRKSKFENIEPPSQEVILDIRNKASFFIPQMQHCARCRADAVGIIGKDCQSIKLNALSIAFKSEKKKECLIKKDRPFVAVASREGIFINLHLGEAEEVMIFGREPSGEIKLIEKRKTPPKGEGLVRWQKLTEILYDVSVLLVSSVGKIPEQTLTENNISVYSVEGLINEVVEVVFNSSDLSKYEAHKKGCNSNISCC